MSVGRWFTIRQKTLPVFRRRRGGVGGSAQGSQPLTAVVRVLWLWVEAGRETGQEAAAAAHPCPQPAGGERAGHACPNERGDLAAAHTFSLGQKSGTRPHLAATGTHGHILLFCMACSSRKKGREGLARW